MDPFGLDLQEKIDDVFGAGFVNTATAGEIAKKAMKNARNSGLPGAHNGPQDAYRHCIWSCYMARAIGVENAKVITDNHEAAGDRVGQPAGEHNMDQHNNAVGRKVAVTCPSSQSSSSPKSCPESCLEQLFNGGLQTSP